MSYSLKAVMLDAKTLGTDVDLGPLKALPVEWTFYDSTAPEQTAERLAEADIVLTNKVVINEAVLKQCPWLKYVGVLATGMNNVDLVAAEKNGVVVRNVANYGTHSVAQHAMAMMLSLAISLPAYSRDSKNGRWQNSDMFHLMDHPILQLHGKTLLIVGSGTLGTEVARLSEAFGMKIIRAIVPGSSSPTEGRVELEEGLKQADVVSLHCPLTAITENMIDYRRLKLMKSHALLINTGRGGLVNEADVVEALKQGEIRGAAFDVLTEEPPRSGNILLDNDLPNLIVTPHTAWISPEARQRIIELSVENLTEYLKTV